MYVFVLAVLVCQTVSDSDHGDATINYNSETFDAALEESKLFVMFYAPWWVDKHEFPEFPPLCDKSYILPTTTAVIVNGLSIFL